MKTKHKVNFEGFSIIELWQNGYRYSFAVPEKLDYKKTGVNFGILALTHLN